MSAGALYSSYPFTSKEQIRILRLAPAADLNEDLRGVLEVRSIRRLGLYDALSYTWQPPFEGQTLPDSVLSIIGFRLPITGNLSNALRRIRRQHRERTLWVDSVCIDQGSIPERNDQVLMMAKIYSKARNVLAWLGEDSSLRDGAYTLASLAAGDVHPSLPRDIEESLPHDKAELDKISNCHRDERTLFQIFATRRFFRRRWVLQELILARTVDVLCGSFALQWNIFVAALGQRCGHDEINMASAHPLAAVSHLMQSIWSIRNGGYATSFFRALRQFEGTDCEDDRDRICALMHINTFPSLWGFTVDYSLPCEDFYCAFATFIHGSYVMRFTDLLCLAALQHGRHRPSLPSWVPDWRLRVEDLIANCLEHDPNMYSNTPFLHDFAIIEDSWSDQCQYRIERNATLLARVPLYDIGKDLSSAKFYCSPDYQLDLSRDLIAGPRFCDQDRKYNDEVTCGLELAMVLHKLFSVPVQYRIVGVCSFRRKDRAVEMCTGMVDVTIV